MKKGDPICFLQDGPKPREVIGLFSHFTASGAAIVYIRNNGFEFKVAVPKKDLRPIDVHPPSLSRVDLRPLTVRASHELEE